MYNGGVKKGKRLDIVIGLPASGKSSAIVNPLSEFYQSVVIDSDIIKQKLPEYQDGWGSSLVHEESSLINAELLDVSLADGNNIVLPIVGSKVGSVEKYIAQAKRYGYSVNLHLNELPGGKAVGRLLKRYFDKGRFIDPTFVAGYGNKPAEVYELLKNRSDIDGYSSWDNDVEYGQRPRCRDSSENARVFAERYGSSGQSGGQISGRASEATNQTTFTETEIAPIKETSSEGGVFFDGKNGTQYSLSDSDGKQLSKGQQEYFKDSKVRDENGNLKVMYHGTPNGDFNVFREGTYFTENKAYADVYQSPGASSISTGKKATNPKTFEVYLDIKKPFDISDAEARKIYINDYIKGGNALGINPYLSDAEYNKIDTIDWTEGEDLRDFLVENGYDYDGLVLDEGAVGGYGDEVQNRGKSYVVFSPEQVKNTDNLNPTTDPDIRFSLSESVEETKELIALHIFNVQLNEPHRYHKVDAKADDCGVLLFLWNVQTGAPIENSLNVTADVP